MEQAAGGSPATILIGVNMSETPKSKSVQRAAKTALARDESARKKGSTVDSFVNFAQNLGIGTDNAMSSSSYGFNPVTRNRTLLEWVHRGSWIGGVAVDVVADDMTRAGVEVKGGMAPEDIERLEECAVGFGIWDKVNEAIKWSRLYGGAIAVMLIDGQDMSTPLRLNTIRKNQFRGLLTLDRWMVEPSLSDLVTELGPEIGLPKFYQVVADAPGLARMKIHHSRCLRLEGIHLPYWQRLIENLWGLSVIERLYDRMIAFDSASTGAAQLVYKSYMRTYKVKDLREVVAAGGDALLGLQAYVNQMRRFQGIEGITLIDGEDEVSAESHGAFGGLADALAQFGQQLSGALQIPLVRLFGQSPQGFSTGDTDLRNYYDKIKQDQEKALRVPLTKIYRAMAASEGINFPEGTKLEFRSLWQLSDGEKADIAQKVESTVSDAEEKGLITKGAALRELKQSSHVTGIFTNITPEDIEDADAEPPPLPEVPEGGAVPGGMQPNGEPAKPATTAAAPSGVPVDPKQVSDALRGVLVRDSGVRAAGILFVDGNGDILLLKRSDGCDEPGTWGLPGGKVDPKESEEDAARREVKEETGFWYAGPLRTLSVNNGFTTFVAHVTKQFTPQLNWEHTEYRWGKPVGNLHPGVMKTLQGL